IRQRYLLKTALPFLSGLLKCLGFFLTDSRRQVSVRLRSTMKLVQAAGGEGSICGRTDLMSRGRISLHRRIIVQPFLADFFSTPPSLLINSLLKPDEESIIRNLPRVIPDGAGCRGFLLSTDLTRHGLCGRVAEWGTNSRICLPMKPKTGRFRMCCPLILMRSMQSSRTA